MTDKTQAVLDANFQATTAGWITVYNVDGTNEFIGSTEEYLMVGVGLPANSYIDAPPAANPGYAICRNSAGTAWVQTENHRDQTVYDTGTLTPSIIQSLGPLSSTQTLMAPVTPYDQWNGVAWVTNATAQKAAQIAAAVAQQEALISAANVKTQLWQTQLMLGIITAADKATLTTWMAYVQAVQAVDTSTAPNIVWPVLPAAQ